MIRYPAKVFPCACMGEGVVVEVEEETRGCEGAPFVTIGFWGFGHKRDKWSWREVLRACWYIIRNRTFWTDMVCMEDKVAKNLAHHILYLIDKEKKSNQLPKPLVETKNE